MRWEGFWRNVNTDSGMVNTDSGKTGKSVHLGPDLVFTLLQNRCSRSTRIGVHDGPEYAVFGHFVNGEGRMLQPGEVGIARIGDSVEHITNEDSSARVLVIWVPGGELPSVEGDARQSWEMLSCP